VTKSSTFDNTVNQGDVEIP